MTSSHLAVRWKHKSEALTLVCPWAGHFPFLPLCSHTYRVKGLDQCGFAHLACEPVLSDHLR